MDKANLRTDSLSSPVTVSSALAYDRRLANRRPVFSLRHGLSLLADGHWHLTREWKGINDSTVAVEDIHWHPGKGLLSAESSAPSMGEILGARLVSHPGVTPACFDSRRVRSNGDEVRQRRLHVPQRAFTLASAPLEIAHAWPSLIMGNRCRGQFLVLKVQRHAAVDFMLHAQDQEYVEISLTPVALTLRWLFGKTIYRFRRDNIALVSIDGLLDPRDRKHSGRWHEYLGRVEFDTPVEFATVVIQAELDSQVRSFRPLCREGESSA